MADALRSAAPILIPAVGMIVGLLIGVYVLRRWLRKNRDE